MRLNASRRAEVASSKSFVAVLDHRGEMIDQDEDAEEAYERARHASPSGTVLVDDSVNSSDDHLPASTSNPPAVGGFVQKALRACQISKVDLAWDWDPRDPEGKRHVAQARAILRDRGAEIYAEILSEVEGLIHEPKRRGERKKRGGIAREFDPAWLTGDFLRQNQKMAKVLEGSSAEYDSIGLSLLPHGASFRDAFSTSSDQGEGGATYCAFSTPECRKVCLVNTGQRALESGAFAASYLFSQLVREQPEAFAVNLFDRCVAAFGAAEQKSFHRFIRLNVLSDLPWETLVPGMIEGACDIARGPRRAERSSGPTGMERGFAFYDYTKIPYRAGVPGYYDLTLSFAGSKGTFPALFDVLEGSPDSAPRTAVVFLKREEKLVRHKRGPAPYRASPGKQLKSDELWHDWTFLGEPVWNGDRSDVRPLDPAEVKIVGLTYKPPHYKVEPQERGKKFGLIPVVPVTDLDKELPTFLVRVRQPDPEAPPIVMATQDPANRRLILPTWK